MGYVIGRPCSSSRVFTDEVCIMGRIDITVSVRTAHPQHSLWGSKVLPLPETEVIYSRVHATAPKGSPRPTTLGCLCIPDCARNVADGTPLAYRQLALSTRTDRARTVRSDSSSIHLRLYWSVNKASSYAGN